MAQRLGAPGSGKAQRFAAPLGPRAMSVGLGGWEYTLYARAVKGLSLLLINNNPSPARRTTNPTRFGPSPPALSKMYIFLMEN